LCSRTLRHSPQPLMRPRVRKYRILPDAKAPIGMTVRLICAMGYAASKETESPALAVRGLRPLRSKSGTRVPVGTAIWSLFRAVESAVACVAGAAADQGLAEGSCARRFIGAAEETSSVKVE